MTRKELEKAWKGASEEEIRTLAESVAIAPTLKSLKQILGRENFLRVWEYMKYLAVGVLWPEVMIILLQKIGFYIHFPFWFFISNILFWIFVLSVRWKNIGFKSGICKSALLLLFRISRRCEVGEIGLLCSALGAFRGGFSSATEEEIDEIVAPLLLHLDDDVRKLPEDAKRWILWRLKRGGSPEFRIAGLLTLASSGDTRLAPVANQLRSASDERVKAAAAEALRIVENRR